MLEFLAVIAVIVAVAIVYMIWKDGKNQEAREEAAKQARVNEAVARGRKLAESVEYVIPARHTHTPKPVVTQRPRDPGRPSAFAAAYGQPHVQNTSDDILGMAATAIIVDELLDTTPSYSYDEPTATVDTSTRYESCSYSSYDSGSSYSSSDSYSSSSDSSSSCSSDSSSW